MALVCDIRCFLEELNTFFRLVWEDSSITNRPVHILEELCRLRQRANNLISKRTEMDELVFRGQGIPRENAELARVEVQTLRNHLLYLKGQFESCRRQMSSQGLGSSDRGGERRYHDFSSDSEGSVDGRRARGVRNTSRGWAWLGIPAQNDRGSVPGSSVGLRITPWFNSGQVAVSKLSHENFCNQSPWPWMGCTLHSCSFCGISRKDTLSHSIVNWMKSLWDFTFKVNPASQPHSTSNYAYCHKSTPRPY